MLVSSSEPLLLKEPPKLPEKITSSQKPKKLINCKKIGNHKKR